MLHSKTFTWVPIPIVSDHCNKRCYTIITIPLRICNDITIQKSQGVNVEPGQEFDKDVSHLPEGAHNQTLCLELVCISRAI